EGEHKPETPVIRILGFALPEHHAGRQKREFLEKKEILRFPAKGITAAQEQQVQFLPESGDLQKDLVKPELPHAARKVLKGRAAGGRGRLADERQGTAARTQQDLRGAVDQQKNWNG